MNLNKERFLLLLKKIASLRYLWIGMFFVVPAVFVIYHFDTYALWDNGTHLSAAMFHCSLGGEFFGWNPSHFSGYIENVRYPPIVNIIAAGGCLFFEPVIAYRFVVLIAVVMYCWSVLYLSNTLFKDKSVQIGTAVMILGTSYVWGAEMSNIFYAGFVGTLFGLAGFVILLSVLVRGGIENNLLFGSAAITIALLSNAYLALAVFLLLGVYLVVFTVTKEYKKNFQLLEMICLSIVLSSFWLIPTISNLSGITSVYETSYWYWTNAFPASAVVQILGMGLGVIDRLNPSINVLVGLAMLNMLFLFLMPVYIGITLFRLGNRSSAVWSLFLYYALLVFSIIIGQGYVSIHTRRYDPVIRLVLLVLLGVFLQKKSSVVVKRLYLWVSMVFFVVITLLNVVGYVKGAAHFVNQKDFMQELSLREITGKTLVMISMESVYWPYQSYIRSMLPYTNGVMAADGGFLMKTSSSMLDAVQLLQVSLLRGVIGDAPHLFEYRGSREMYEQTRGVAHNLSVDQIDALRKLVGVNTVVTVGFNDFSIPCSKRDTIDLENEEHATICAFDEVPFAEVVDRQAVAYLDREWSLESVAELLDLLVIDGVETSDLAVERVSLEEGVVKLETPPVNNNSIENSLPVLVRQAYSDRWFGIQKGVEIKIDRVFPGMSVLWVGPDRGDVVFEYRKGFEMGVGWIASGIGVVLWIGLLLREKFFS